MTRKPYVISETRLTIGDAARRLGISASTLRARANANLIECERTSRGDRLFAPAVILREKLRRQAKRLQSKKGASGQ